MFRSTMNANSTKILPPTVRIMQMAKLSATIIICHSSRAGSTGVISFETMFGLVWLPSSPFRVPFKLFQSIMLSLFVHWYKSPPSNSGRYIGSPSIRWHSGYSNSRLYNFLQIRSCFFLSFLQSRRKRKPTSIRLRIWRREGRRETVKSKIPINLHK